MVYRILEKVNFKFKPLSVGLMTFAG